MNNAVKKREETIFFFFLVWNSLFRTGGGLHSQPSRSTPLPKIRSSFHQQCVYFPASWTWVQPWLALTIRRRQKWASCKPQPSEASAGQAFQALPRPWEARGGRAWWAHRGHVKKESWVPFIWVRGKRPPDSLEGGCERAASEEAHFHTGPGTNPGSTRERAGERGKRPAQTPLTLVLGLGLGQLFQGLFQQVCQPLQHLWALLGAPGGPARKSCSGSLHRGFDLAGANRRGHLTLLLSRSRS